MMVEEPLTTVSNICFWNNSAKKQQIPINLTFATNFQVNSLNTNSTKKDNDKKKWLKRI